MTAAIPHPTLTFFPMVRARVTQFGSHGFGVCAWDTDSIGTFYLSLTNVVVGSRVHVEKQSDGTQYYDGLAEASTVGISLSVYAAGSAYNALRIKVRKASAAPKYKPFEILATAVVGSQSIYIAQEADPIA